MTRKLNRRLNAFRRLALSIAVTALISLAALAQKPSADRLGLEIAHPVAKANQPLGTDSMVLDAPLFLPAVAYASGGFSTTSVAVGDINGDGKPDLLVASLSISPAVFNSTGIGTTLVLLNNGDGTFRAVGNYGSDASFTTSVAIADVNSDGKPDMVVSDLCGFANCQQRTGGTVTVRTGNGDGTFAGGDFVYGSGGDNPGSVRVADVNGDGKPDLIVSNCGNGCQGVPGLVGILLGNGDATFQSAVTYNSGGVGAKSVVVADVNADGKLDLVVANLCATINNCPGTVNGSVGVLLGNGNGTFQTAVAYDPGGTVSRSVRAADVNGDNKVDIVVANGSDTVGVLLGNGDGSFQAAVTYFAGGGDNNSIAVADVNQDGKPDLVVTSPNGLSVLLGNGDGSFQTPVTTGSGGVGPTGLAVADLNGDGRPDAAVANRCFNDNPNCPHGSVGVLLNNTGPHSPTTTALVSNVNPAAVNQQVIYTATVTNQSGGPITGTVIFQHGAATTVQVVDGQASYSTAYTRTGTHMIRAVYSGDTANESSTSATFTEYVGLAPTITTLTTSGSPSHVGQSVTFMANVTWTYGTVPNGEVVTFFDGAIAIGTGTTAGGVATFSASSLSAKTHTIKAKYPGDATFKPSAGKVTQVVELYATTTTLTSSPNPSQFGQVVTFTAHVRSTGPAPTGKVKFLDGTTGIGLATLNGSGVAKLTKSTLAVGTHPITAQYLGDAVSAKSTSSVVNQVVQ